VKPGKHKSRYITYPKQSTRSPMQTPTTEEEADLAVLRDRGPVRGTPSLAISD
jgi:hypothetical protein